MNTLESADRIRQCLDTIEAYQDTEEDSACDLLTDLMHFCAQQGIDFNALLVRARNHFNQEQ